MQKLQRVSNGGSETLGLQIRFTMEIPEDGRKCLDSCEAKETTKTKEAPSSYVEILRKIMGDPRLSVKKRELLQHRETQDEKTLNYQNLATKSLTVWQLTREIIVECRNHNEITSIEYEQMLHDLVLDASVRSRIIITGDFNACSTGQVNVPIYIFS